MSTNLALQLQVIETDKDLNNIMIGNSRYTDDVWDLSPYIPSPTIVAARKSIRFGFIKNEKTKMLVKRYVCYKLSHNAKPLTVIHYIHSRLPHLIEYLEKNSINDFTCFTFDDYLMFNEYLKQKKISVSTGYHCCHLVEELISIGQIKKWDVPVFKIPKNATSNQLWNMNRAMKASVTEPIPEEVFNKILFHAINDERDILTKAGIIIQSQTGLRISEVLSIKEDCLKETLDGDTYIEVSLSKTEKGEPIIHKVFVNELVKNTIYELSKHTEALRKESGFTELFLIRRYGIRILNPERWTDNRLPHFIERWDIRDKDGSLYPLKSHQFRATFVRELIKRNVPIAMIMKQYSHVSIEMTAHYLTLKEEEVKEIYSDMFLSPKAKIAGLRAKEIKDKLDVLFNGKTKDEIDGVIAGLAKTMSFNPLPTGICLYDFRRGNCTDGDGCFFYNCPNYITEVQFYPILKDELVLLEKEMARLKELGQEREWQKHYIKHKYLKPLVERLEVQLNGEESVG